jgi:GDP-mannose 6-dehydrogenase
MRISIFGAGYVGAVSGACLAKEGHDIVAVDKSSSKVELLNAGRSPIVEVGIAELIAEVVRAKKLRATTNAVEAVHGTDVSLVSVGTPSQPSGALSLDAVRAVTREIGAAIKTKRGPHVVVYRSTILPGTTDEQLVPLLVESSGRRIGDGLDVVYNPEFLREGSSIADFHAPPYTIVGSPTPRGYEAMDEMYRSVKAEMVRTTIRLAESVKYLSNMYHALKICFANEAGAVLKSLGVDARAALEIFCKDQVLNISKAYLRPGFAFGGSCLPKDLRAFLALARHQEISVPMLGQVLPSNERHLDRALGMIQRHGRGKVALFGLAFKGGTDDLRESPMVTLAERLIGKGFELAIHDEHVHTASLVGSNREYVEKEIPHLDRLLRATPEEALRGADLIVVAKCSKHELAAILAAPAEIPVIDLASVRELAAARAPRYEGICW